MSEQKSAVGGSHPVAQPWPWQLLAAAPDRAAPGEAGSVAPGRRVRSTSALDGGCFRRGVAFEGVEDQPGQHDEGEDESEDGTHGGWQGPNDDQEQ